MIKYEEYIKKNKLGVLYTNKMFKDIDTIKIGGNIRLLYYPNTIENFISFYKYYLLYRDYPLIVIGNGSNILPSSNDYNGIVICFKKIKYKYSLINSIITVNSGVMLMDLLNYCINKNLSGLEYLAYIPGTIGGMVRMNAEAYNHSISDNILNIKVIDNKGNIKYYTKEDIIFSYRKCSIPKDDIILEISFQLKKDCIKEVVNNIKEERKLKQPINEFNAGSTFKNPNNLKAWELIENLNLKGFSINDAMVSVKHSNFLINKSNCSSDDMIELINYIIKKVKENYKINLECEWIFINL